MQNRDAAAAAAAVLALLSVCLCVCVCGLVVNGVENKQKNKPRHTLKSFKIKSLGQSLCCRQSTKWLVGCEEEEKKKDRKRVEGGVVHLSKCSNNL